MATRFLYLHGFASGPGSTKGVAFAAHYAARGVAVERLDLRLPSLEQLRLSAMIAAVERAIGGGTGGGTGGAGDRAVVVGSSLGGLTAARVAERDPRVVALVLLAPAFGLVERWRARPGWDDWQRTGWREIHDHATQGQWNEASPALVDRLAGADAGCASYGEDRRLEASPAQRAARVDFGFAEDAMAIDTGMPDVRIPTLILHGTRDDVVPIEASRAFSRGRAGVQLVELDDGHELVASLPRLLAEADRFLAPWLA